MLYKKGDDGIITEEISETALSDLLAADAERITGLHLRVKTRSIMATKRHKRKLLKNWKPLSANVRALLTQH